jgi:hypothetical protein
LSGASNVLQSLQTSFHQDLNGEGVIGIAPNLPAGKQPDGDERYPGAVVSRFRNGPCQRFLRTDPGAGPVADSGSADRLTTTPIRRA